MRFNNRKKFNRLLLISFLILNINVFSVAAQERAVKITSILNQSNKFSSLISFLKSFNSKITMNFQLLNIIVSILFIALIFFLIVQKRLSNSLNNLLQIESLTLEINYQFNINSLDIAIESAIKLINEQLNANTTLYVDISLDNDLFVVKKTTNENNMYFIEYLQEINFLSNTSIYNQITTKKAFHLKNLKITSNYPNNFPPKIKSALFLPIIVDEKISNYIVVLSDKMNLNFTDEKLNAFDLLSSTISNATMNNLASEKESNLTAELEEKNQELDMVFKSIDFELLKLHLSKRKIEPILTSKVNINPSSTTSTFINVNFHPECAKKLLKNIEKIRKNHISSLNVDCRVLRSPYNIEDFYWGNVQIFSDINNVFKFNNIAYLIINNIDQRKHSEFIINERNQKLNHIIESSSNIIIEMDKNSKPIFLNEVCRKKLGITTQKLSEIKYSDYVHPDDLGTFKIIEESYENNIIYEKPFTVTNRIKTIEEGYRWYEWNVNVIYEDNQINRRISIGRDITHQLDNEKRINYDINHDSLTGLYNAKYLKQQLEKIPENEFTFCVFINIDNFRQINDTYGHKFGDEFLIQLSKRIKITFPEEYIKLLARVSGDEFAILSNKKPENSFEIHTKFKEYLEKINIFPITCYGEQIPFSVSVGYADYPFSTNDPNEIFRFSEIAMFEAKKNRRNGVAKFDNSLYLKRLNTQKVTKEVQQSDFNNDFFMVYHPIFDLNNKQKIYVEALIRWNHPKKRNIKT